MLNFLLEFSVRQRALVLLGAFCLLGGGLYSLMHLPIDAVPDLTGPQVQVNVAVPALAPEESERAITRPIEMALSGMPGVLDSRSITKFGLSQVTVEFEDGTDIFRARQLVTERLTPVMQDLPPGSEVTLRARLRESRSPRELRDGFPLRVELLLEADHGYITLVPKKLLPIEEAAA